ncbi:MAG: hypothetical protein D6692_11870 [Planctomycetota bacterium]|nr:MAG: hypothetical protein D6692_11870 [Planctomycetota bacterium]
MMNSSVTVISLLSLFAGSTLAIEPGAAIPPSEPGLIDPGDVVEFAGHYWYWYDTGIITPEAAAWTPSNPAVVATNTHFFHEAMVIFEDIYAGWIDNDLDSPNYYPIDDLLQDDPSVMQQFRDFTSTGILTTRSGASSSETINHLLLVLEASTQDDPCTGLRGSYTVSVAPNGGLIVSSSGLERPKEKCDEEPDPDPDQPNDLPPFLRDLKDNFLNLLMNCLPDGIFDMHDGWFTPGVDCDDYADMLAEYLRRQLQGQYPDLEISQLWLTWYNGDGHVITLVRVNGQYYVIDAQTAESRGPYNSVDDAKNGAWDIMEGYGVDKDDVFLPKAKKRPPEWRPLTEPDPWHTNPDIIDMFDGTDMFDGQPCDPLDLVPPGSGGNPE